LYAGTSHGCDADQVAGHAEGLGPAGAGDQVGGAVPQRDPVLRWGGADRWPAGLVSVGHDGVDEPVWPSERDVDGGQVGALGGFDELLVAGWSVKERDGAGVPVDLARPGLGRVR
jgi:hypothetical protein